MQNTSHTKKISKELSLISRYASLKYSKYILIVLLLLMYFPFKTTPVYILFAVVTIPVISRFATGTARDASSPAQDFILLYTARKYNYTEAKYKNEKKRYYLSIFLLLAWQIKINSGNYYNMPLKAVPSMLIIIYISVQVIIGIFVKYKTRYNFMHLNI